MLLSSEIALCVKSYLLSETEAIEALILLMGQGDVLFTATLLTLCCLTSEVGMKTLTSHGLQKSQIVLFCWQHVC